MALGKYGGQSREGISPADSIWHVLFRPVRFSCKAQTPPSMMSAFKTACRSLDIRGSLGRTWVFNTC